MTISRYIVGLSLLLQASIGLAQYNCSATKDSAWARACRIYTAADSFYQGSAKSQYYYDSAIKVCPNFAPAWHEKSVPYLKRGDFVGWRKLLDEAVRIDPRGFLAVRGWCRFKFLRDYEGALDDLQRYDTLSAFGNNFSGDGSYELHIVMALCERELGNTAAAFHYFAIGIDSVVAQKGFGFTGLYDYLHLGVTKIRSKDYAGAIAVLEKENRKYDKFAETYYYLGIACLAMGRKTDAISHLLQARALLNDGSGKYYLHDIYCEMPDAIYLSNVEEALARARD